MLMCDATELPSIIASWPEGDIRTVMPRGDRPLTGRQFVLGYADCWSLIMDYFRIEHGIELPNYSVDRHWWEQGENLYMDNWQECGFREYDGPAQPVTWLSCRFSPPSRTMPGFCLMATCYCITCMAS